MALRIVTIIAGLLVIWAIASVIDLPAGLAPVLGVLALSKSFESISDILYGLLQQHERMDRIAISMVIKGVVSLAAFCIVMILTRSLLWGSIALAATSFVMMLTYDLGSGIILMRRVNSTDGADGLAPRWNKGILRRLFIISLPLGFVMMLVSLNTNIPRYAIQRYSGEHDLGIFAAITALLVAGTTIVCALGQSASPRLAKYYSAGDRHAFTNLTNKLLLVGLTMGAAGVVIVAAFGSRLLNLIYGRTYAGYTSLFIWVAIAAGVSYLQSLNGFAVTSARCFKAQAPLLAAVSIVTLVCCYVLVPIFGLVGAGAALAAAALAHVIGNSFLYRRALANIGTNIECEVIDE